VLKPTQSGLSNSTHAVITYQKSEKNTNVQVRNELLEFNGFSKAQSRLFDIKMNKQWKLSK
jgi:hypothetical protein